MSKFLLNNFLPEHFFYIFNSFLIKCPDKKKYLCTFPSIRFANCKYITLNMILINLLLIDINLYEFDNF